MSTLGQALDLPTRRFAESRLGHDFSEVRVHTDGRADQSARDLGALAYAYGADVVFSSGAFSPRTAEGRRLLVHELAHVVQQRGRSPLVQRQRAAQVRPATAADHREYVQLTIEFFHSSADFYGDPHLPVRLDAAGFERVIDNWYLMVVEREQTIDVELHRDAALNAQLRAAYTAAIRALIMRAGSVFGRSEADLYRENSGRIPPWALTTPSRLEPGIATPIPESSAIDLMTDAATVSTNGFDVTIAPDTTDRALGDEAETRIHIDWGRVEHQSERIGRTSRITRFEGPGRPTARIQTFFGPGATPTGPSEYGRGTTPQDVAAGRVTPRSTTLGFHEGRHGLAFLEFLQANPPPRFTGTVGMTESAFVAARGAWQAAGRDYVTRINRFSKTSVDCVGTTIDEFHHAHGMRSHIVCRR